MYDEILKKYEEEGKIPPAITLHGSRFSCPYCRRQFAIYDTKPDIIHCPFRCMELKINPFISLNCPMCKSDDIVKVATSTLFFPVKLNRAILNGRRSGSRTMLKLLVLTLLRSMKKSPAV
jgi:hypothetical protein